MKKLLFIFLPIFFGCGESQEKVQSDFDKLVLQRTTLNTEVRSIRQYKDNLNSEVKDLTEKMKELKILENGGKIQYVIKLKLSQSHFTIDPFEHIKDGMNAVTFELPVDKDFYHKVKSGDKLVNNFRAGSFIMNGSIGDWDLEITGKEIRNK